MQINNYMNIRAHFQVFAIL